MSGIFISYASADREVAVRVHNDLRRAGAMVWRFEEDARSSDLLLEARARIRGCAVFLLIDSPNARQSRAVRSEVHLLRERMDEPHTAPRLILCATTDAGRWQVTDQLFDGHLMTRAVALNSYESGIRELSALLGFDYTPRFTMPRHQDFAGELDAMDISADDRKRLLDCCDIVRRQLDASQLADAERELQAMIDACEESAHRIVSPHLALGTLLTDLIDDGAAVGVFLRATEIAPHDPRGWSGLGSALHYQGDYAAATQAFEECERRIGASSNAYYQSRAIEIRVSLAAALSAAGRTHEALVLLTSMQHAIENNTRLLTLLGHLMLLHGDAVGAKRFLRRAEALVPITSTMALGTWLDLADTYAELGERDNELAVLTRGLATFPDDPDLHRRMGTHLAAAGEIHEAEESLRHAITLKPTFLAARAELAFLLNVTGDTHEALAEATKSIALQPQSASDHYYLGLAHHIIGDGAAATIERRLSRRDSRIARWPEYATLAGGHR